MFVSAVWINLQLDWKSQRRSESAFLSNTEQTFDIFGYRISLFLLRSFHKY